MSRVPSIHCQSSLSQGLHQIRYSMSLSSIGDRMKDGFEFGSAVRLPAAFRFENGTRHRVAARKRAIEKMYRPRFRCT
jgi:hypothetical protein